MTEHSHEFVETYAGLVGFGLDRKTDEQTLMYYLQKFSDDRLISVLTSRMTDAELSQVFDLISGLLHAHLNEDEYHLLFLKDKKG